MNRTIPEIVALLPIKGHSERIPGKNFRDFLGKPLFRWILSTLLSMEEISRIVINTDAEERLRRAGLPDSGRILIRDRKAEIRGDMVSMNRVIADDVQNVPAGIYLMTHATNPLLSTQTVSRALDLFRRRLAENRCDSLFSVNRVQTRFYRADGTAVNHDPEHLVRTQDLEPWFEENSCLYLFTQESFAATWSRIGKNPYLFEMAPWEAVDIDDSPGWYLAEALGRQQEEGRVLNRDARPPETAEES